MVTYLVILCSILEIQSRTSERSPFKGKLSANDEELQQEMKNYQMQLDLLKEEAQDIRSKLSAILENKPSVNQHIDEPTEIHTGVTNEIEGFFHSRHRRAIDSSANNLQNTISSNAGSNECYLCPAGPAGKQGPRGWTGLPGITGRDGERGPKGDKGNAGEPGRPGRDGRDGRDGSCSGDDMQITTETPTTPASTQSNRSISGAVYTRWGRSTCPDTSQLVYEGFAAGSYFNNKGGSVEILCLPNTPLYSYKMAGRQDVRSPLFRVEYHTSAFPPFNSLRDHDMPCVVCMAPLRHSKILVPARNICPTPEWTHEYSGYLHSAKKNYFRTETICIDVSSEALPGTSGNVNGALVTPVEYRCQPPPQCNEYQDGFELTCAICTL